ncbi:MULTISPECIES: beta-ketoacyl-ACP synthase III [Clostridium]|uniref:Beta-ketoacyl-[acyl-carrier-protein] synthase III n=1 Tax=Clostridium aquiflavi TaxID=3073603 RepID=A0ABU1EEJ1_9CLOT|nr:MULTISPECIES: beta-ketoacyl-ACP synthase III [unclassified Clostridium]MDR5586806.1 beta-ketoacyl-ACP synthase III [Clostridium sp. 5N-1]NFG62625.1 ketoacyl-ACP synthase III [Clostridium botulinum]NFQ10013.1 ketoacyl-ACP synthase III [Clostridium botulinum]
MNIKIGGVGGYLPSLVVTNDKISEFVDTNDEWIVERTGIKERRISEGENTSEIAVKAAKVALERAKIDSEDLDLIIVATITPDMFMPSVACLVQKELNANKAAAFDINVACSGFVFALETANSLMKSLNYKNALVIGAETLSKVINWNDRGTCILFGDGGGAAVLVRDEKNGIINSYLKTDGKKGDSLTIGALDFNTPFTKENFISNQYVEMNGREVFKFATSAIIKGIDGVLEGTDVCLNDIKYIVPHQANIRILDYVAKKLKIDINKFYINLDKTGNTSSASVPLALNELYEKNLLEEGDKILLVAFGGGLSYGATLLEW